VRRTDANESTEHIRPEWNAIAPDLIIVMGGLCSEDSSSDQWEFSTIEFAQRSEVDIDLGICSEESLATNRIGHRTRENENVDRATDRTCSSDALIEMFHIRWQKAKARSYGCFFIRLVVLVLSDAVVKQRISNVKAHCIVTFDSFLCLTVLGRQEKRSRYHHQPSDTSLQQSLEIDFNLQKIVALLDATKPYVDSQMKNLFVSFCTKKVLFNQRRLSRRE
jgi:hypothetical protein